MTLIIILFITTIATSFLCSLMEAVILSTSRAHIEAMMRKKIRSGRFLKDLKHNINRPLSAILTVNTIANTIGAAAVGAETLNQLGSKWAAAITAFLTVTILTVSEILPKTLGAVYWRQLAPATGYLLTGLVKLLAPLVKFFEIIARRITPKGQIFHFSREDMIAAAELSTREGSLLSQETRIIHNLLGLNNIRVKGILTPRSVVLAWQKDLTVDEVVTRYGPLRFSRIPIYGRDLDDIVGIVLRCQVLDAYSRDQTQLTLEQIAKPVHIIPETKSIASVLDEFIKRREHLFVVVDEYGGSAGIVTLEDAIETLLGVEILDESDSVADMRDLAKKLWEHRQKLQKDHPLT